MLRTSRASILSVLLLAVASGKVLAAPAQVPTPGAAAAKSAVAAALPKLGELEPWQKRIFNDEVVPLYPRFVRNLEAASAGSAQADVDVPAIREHLRFHESRVRASGEPRRTMAVLISVPKSCVECELAIAKFKTLISMRLDRRGYSPVWIQEGDLGLVSSSARSAGALDGTLGAIAESAKGRAAGGIWWVEFKQLGAEELDAGHADEKIFRLTSKVAVFRPGRGSYSSMLKPLLRHDARVELRDAESPELVLGGATADAFADFGVHLDGALASIGSRGGESAETDRPETRISASGFRDFAQFQKLKAALERRLGETLELRTLARGVAEFALPAASAGRGIAEAKSAISGLAEAEDLDGIELELLQ